LASGNRDGKPKKPVKTTLSDQDLAHLALEGLLTGLGLGADWEQLKDAPVNDPTDELCSTCAKLLEVAHDIGQAFFADDRPNNQFALYNLAHSRILLRNFGNLQNLLGEDEANSPDTNSGDKTDNSSLNRVTSAMAALSSMISNYAAHSLDSDPDSDKSISSTLTKYFNRDSFRMSKRENYGIALFFLIGLAARADYNFESDKMLSASPAIQNVILEARSVLSEDGATPAQIGQRAVEALTRSRFAKLAHIFLGGLLEVGATDFKNLWRPLFGENPSAHTKLSGRDSAERHYVCYRLTSSERDVEVLKSFLVFQAPGLVKPTQTRREHFAMKAFTQYDSGLMRSVGAVVELGEEIVGFASRRQQQEDPAPGLLNPDQFRGATMLIFGKIWFVAGKGVLLGMLMTTNQKSRNMACPILCLRSNATHSDDADLSVINRSQFVEDMCKNTWLEAGEDADPKALGDYLWHSLLSRPAGNVVYEPDNDGPDCAGCPPIVAPEISPRGLGNAFRDHGFSMKGS